jgi:hypothetical protein
MSRPAPVSRLSVALATALAAASCATTPETGTVTGKVTALNPHSGEVEPVPFGHVYCHHLDSDRPFAGAIVEGRYEVRGVPAGEVKVLVLSPQPDPDDPGDPVNDGGFRPDPRKWFPLPKRYEEVDATPLKLVVRPGTQSFDIELR